MAMFGDWEDSAGIVFRRISSILGLDRQSYFNMAMMVPLTEMGIYIEGGRSKCER